MFLAFILHSSVPLGMPTSCSNVQIFIWQCPNQACHASHLCGGLHQGASCRLWLPGETAHPKHLRGQEGQRCSQAEEFQEVEVLMDVELEALEVHGHVRGAEPATAVAVIYGGISRLRQNTQPIVLSGKKNKTEKKLLVSQLHWILLPVSKTTRYLQCAPVNHLLLDFTTPGILPQVLIPVVFCRSELGNLIYRLHKSPVSQSRLLKISGTLQTHLYIYRISSDRTIVCPHLPIPQKPIFATASN